MVAQCALPMDDERTRGLALDLAYLRGRTREAPESPPEISDRTWAICRARAHRALIEPVVVLLVRAFRVPDRVTKTWMIGGDGSLHDEPRSQDGADHQDVEERT
jgi:hypothetical protein